MKTLGPIFGAFLALNGGWANAGDEPKRDAPALEMSKAVACRQVNAYEDYVELAGASLTSEDKLLVYYRPLHFKVEPVEKPSPGSRYKAKFLQDGRIRKKGEKAVLMKKDSILEYDPTFETPFERIYLTNTVGLRGLPPGEYEYDIVLHDGLEKESTATQTLPFTIVPVPKVDPPKAEKPAGPESPAGPKEKSKAKAPKPKA